jgi:hypothetical protein
VGWCILFHSTQIALRYVSFLSEREGFLFTWCLAHKFGRGVGVTKNRFVDLLLENSFAFFISSDTAWWIPRIFVLHGS